MTALWWFSLGAVLGVVSTAAFYRRRSAGFGHEIVNKSPTDPTDELSTLRQGSAQLQTALDALQIGVLVANGQGDVAVHNRAATSIGRDANAHVLVHAAAQHHLREALRGIDGSQTVELYGPPRRVIVVAAQSLSDHGAVVTMEDVTERSRLDAVRTDFVANISHELKTPIGALAVLAETLIDEPDPVMMRRLAEKTVDEAHRVGRTIDDLLELSRIELSGEINRRTVEIGSLIAAAIARSNYLAQSRKISVEVGDVPHGCKLSGDPLQLESALGNLVDNAVKYSEPGDTVTISAEQTSAAIVVQVADEGVGIPAHDIDRIFERFYRVDRGRSRATGGTGLGLSIARHVAQNHGGTVSVSSRVGEGSVFRLTLPSIQQFHAEGSA